MTTVDLLVPAYGPVRMLAELVDSVRAQSDPHWRLVIVDDAYPDDDLASWARALDDERIVYLRNPENLGLSRNFNRCLAEARGELVTLVGSDDVLLPEYVAVVRAAHGRHPEAAMIQPGVSVVDDDGEPARTLVDLAKKYVYAPARDREVVLSGERLAASLLRGNWLYFPSLCWRREALVGVGFQEHLHTVLDLATELELVRADHALVVDPTVCFRYRRHRGSVSSWRARDGSRFDEEKAFFAAEARRMRERGWARAARVARWHLSSRLNALCLVPGAARARDGAARGALLRHALLPDPGGCRPRDGADEGRPRRCSPAATQTEHHQHGD
jgi:glycosyltransferase involved in cell wall biosynthesis